MSETFTNILTKIGQQKKALAEASGVALNITTFKVGDGNGSYYEPNENQTALVNVKYTGAFVAGTQSQIIINPSASNEVLYKCFIPADVGGFTIRELGLFDKDNDLILICKLPAQDKFALASGLYQPLNFTPKIIYTNPQTQAVLTPTSQTVPTTGEVTTLIQEGISESLEGINYNDPIKNTDGEISLDFDYTLKLTSGKLGVAKVANNTKFCINNGNTTNGTADLLSYSGTTLFFNVGGDYPSVLFTYADNSQEILTSLTEITGLSTDGTYAILKEIGSNPVAVGIPILGKDLYVDFSKGNANDNYGLHTPSVIGSPTYAGNKFNSNGATAVAYPIKTLGVGTWCTQGKFKFNTNNVNYCVISAVTASPYYGGFSVQRNVSNKLCLYMSSNNTTYNISNAVLGIKADWDTITEYYIRCRFTGTQYLIDWSIDHNPITNAGTWTNDITINSSTLVYQTLASFNFGCTYSNLSPLVGTMDDLQVTIGQSTCQIKNQVTQGKILPLYRQNGDRHCSTATTLKTTKIIDGVDVDNQWVKFAGCVVAGGVITGAFTEPYNESGYVPCARTVASLSMPDYAKKIAITPTSANNFTATCDLKILGCIQGDAQAAQHGIFIAVDGISYHFYDNKNCGGQILFAVNVDVPKGAKISFDGIYQASNIFKIPLKGAII